MDKQLVKEVLEKLVEIDQTADQLLAERQAYQAEVDAEVKQKMHSMELDVMKAARARVKSEFSEANAKSDSETKNLTEQTAQHIAAVNNYYKEHKTALVDQLFDDIFGEGNNG